MGKGNSPNMSLSEDFECLAHSNWTICTNYIFQILQLFDFYTGEDNFYYHRERKAENGKREFSQPEPGGGFWVPGTFKFDIFQAFAPITFPKFCNLFTFILERPILITPEKGRLKMGKWNSPNLSKAGDFEWLGHSNWTICCLLSWFCSINFQTFAPLLLERPIFITPDVEIVDGDTMTHLQRWAKARY